MANMNVEQMVEELSSWTVMDVAKLVKTLPQDLQPYVCRKKGSYAKSVNELWGDLAPKGLEDMGVVTSDLVEEAVEAFLASRD